MTCNDAGQRSQNARYFDSDVLIYATVVGHELGRRVRALFPPGPVDATGAVAGIGSVLLLPECWPSRCASGRPRIWPSSATSWVDLTCWATDEATARLATALSATYWLRAADVVHLATAVAAGADRLVTNNRRDFPKTITEIDITCLADLADPDTEQADQ